MWLLILVPFAIQAIAMVFDEGYFHLRRGLPRWERIGHPIDTLSVLACMGFILMAPFNSITLAIYISLAAFSTILVTKDEFVHHEHCPATEQWLHALLFTLHPITLCLAGFMWPTIQGVLITWLNPLFDHKEALTLFLYGQFTLMTGFLFYQIIYWNFVYAPNKQ